MPCIFCGATENLTDEHVFPAFTGSDLVVRGGSCKTCNEKCSKFEGEVAAQTETARHIFDIPNRDGVVPRAKVKVEIGGTNMAPITGRRNSEGEIQLHDFVARVNTEDGKKIREGFFVSEESAKKFIKRSEARGEKVTELDVPKEITLLSSSQQTIEFAFSAAMRRIAAKVAYVAVAYWYGVDFARLPQFAALRDSILGSGNDLPLRIFSNKDFVSDHLRTPRQHSVRAYLSAGMHKGWAVVALFGGLSFIVELTREFNNS